MSELAHDKLVSARGLAVLDAALLFEAGWDELVEASVVVLAPLETRIERIMVRDGMTRESALSRIAAQLCDAERLKRADHIIYNMGDLNMIHAHCERIFLSDASLYILAARVVAAGRSAPPCRICACANRRGNI